MKPRCIIVHGWDFNPSMHWYPWLKRELEKKGYEVIIPEMPNTSEPTITAWVSHLKNTAGTLNAQTHFVGHSIGCQTIMRFLEQEDYNGRVGRVCFVAGWFSLENLEDCEIKTIAHPWLTSPIDFDKVKQKLSKLTVFLSSNEPYGCIDHNTTTFKEKLGAHVVIEHNKGHFTADDEVTEVPEVVQEFQGAR